MPEKKDDLDAVRNIVKTLEGFDRKEQERIIRWSREKLGLSISIESPPAGPPPRNTEKLTKITPQGSASKTQRNIKTFVIEKNPRSDNQFAATVAYYYRFEAPEAERKDSVTGDDLQEACRKVGRPRLKLPGKTLSNAHAVGLLDKTGERGTYSINTVGENLVAMTLPGGSPSTITSRAAKVKKTTKKRKQGAKKIVKK